MSNLQAALVIIMGEVCLILFAILGYIGYRYIRKHRGEMSAIQHLNHNINNNNDSRITQLEDFLTSTCRFTGEAAETAARELIQKQQNFYNSLIAIYTSRDQNALLGLDQKTEEVIDAYRELVTESTRIIEQDVQAGFDDRADTLNKTIDDLSEKNKDLSGKIDQLEEEMEITVQEYSSAFQSRPDKHEGKPEDGSEPMADNKADQPTDTAIPDEPAMDDEDSGITIDIDESATTDTIEQDPDIAAKSEKSAESIDITLPDEAIEVEKAVDTESPAAASAPELNKPVTQAKKDKSTTVSASAPPAVEEKDDSIEPDFETHSINGSTENNTSINTDLDEEIKADLEALTEQFDADETEPEELISLDGLEDDTIAEQPQQQTAQR